MAQSFILLNVSLIYNKNNWRIHLINLLVSKIKKQKDQHLEDEIAQLILDRQTKKNQEKINERAKDSNKRVKVEINRKINQKQNANTFWVTNAKVYHKLMSQEKLLLTNANENFRIE